MKKYLLSKTFRLTLKHDSQANIFEKTQNCQTNWLQGRRWRLYRGGFDHVACHVGQQLANGRQLACMARLMHRMPRRPLRDLDGPIIVEDPGLWWRGINGRLRKRLSAHFHVADRSWKTED